MRQKTTTTEAVRGGCGVQHLELPARVFRLSGRLVFLSRTTWVVLEVVDATFLVVLGSQSIRKSTFDPYLSKTRSAHDRARPFPFLASIHLILSNAFLSLFKIPYHWDASLSKHRH